MQTLNIIHYFFPQEALGLSKLHTYWCWILKIIPICCWFICCSLLGLPKNCTPSLTVFNNCCQRADRDVSLWFHIFMASSVLSFLWSDLLFILCHMWSLAALILMADTAHWHSCCWLCVFPWQLSLWGSARVSRLSNFRFKLWTRTTQNPDVISAQS